jgi:anti-repressor protein
MSAPAVFAYADNQLRTVVIDGEPWFVLADICKVLGLARGASQVAERLPRGVRQAYPLATDGGTQQALVVSEAGLYRVVRLTAKGLNRLRDEMAVA